MRRSKKLRVTVDFIGTLARREAEAEGERERRREGGRVSSNDASIIISQRCTPCAILSHLSITFPSSVRDRDGNL